MPTAAMRTIGAVAALTAVLSGCSGSPSSYDNTVTAVDLTNLTAVDPIPVGTQPSGISYSSHPPVAAPANAITIDIPPLAPPNQTTPPDEHSGHHQLTGAMPSDGS